MLLKYHVQISQEKMIDLWPKTLCKMDILHVKVYGD